MLSRALDQYFERKKKKNQHNKTPLCSSDPYPPNSLGGFIDYYPEIYCFL